MPLLLFSSYYKEVNTLWEIGENPTVKVGLTPTRAGLPTYNYTNYNKSKTEPESPYTTYVDSLFEITISYPGGVEEGNIGVSDTLHLTSNGYTSTFYFEQCAIQLNESVMGFLKTYGNSNYQLSVEIYADVLNPPPNINRQAKVRGDVTSTGIAITVTPTVIPTSYTDSSGTYTLYTFTNTKNATYQANYIIQFSNVLDSVNISVLAIGGGGGGNGGGAGGFIEGIYPLPLVRDNEVTIYISVGPGCIDIVPGSTGGNTTLIFNNLQSNTITAYGGGTGSIYGANGGSGGGGLGVSSEQQAGQGTPGQGNNGGNGNNNENGGGGGASSPGQDIVNNSNGNGGDGLIPSVSGIPNSTYYAGGGGGAPYSTDGLGADSYGGGAGNTNEGSGQNGVVQIAILTSLLS